MNAAAANALLKTLEEPPAGTYLILVADQPGRLPPTIVSRCRKLAAPLPAPDEARGVARRRRASTTPDLALAQAGGAPLAALAHADAGWRGRAARLARGAGAAASGCRCIALAARIDAGGKDERKARLARVIDWLLAWTADLARVAAGGARAAEPGRRGGARARSRARVAPVALFRYHRSLLRQARMLAHPLQPRARRRGAADRLPGAVLTTMADNKPMVAAADAPTAAASRGPACSRSTSASAPRSTPRTCRSSRAAASSSRRSRQYQLGEEVFMLLSLMDDPNRIAVQGKVVWITPEGVQGNRTQGIGVQFTQDETGATARATIEKILGETLASSRPTHTM